MNSTHRLLITATILAGVLLPAAVNAQRRFDDRGQDGRMIRYREDGRIVNYYLPAQRERSNSGRFYTRGDNHYYIPLQQGRRRGPLNARRFEFGGFSHIEQLSRRLERVFNSIALDMYYNYSHNRNFRDVYETAYELLQLSKEVHEASTQERDVQREIRREVRRMDRLFHRLQRETEGWSRHQHRQVGQQGIFRKMRAIDTMLHHLMYDVGLEHRGSDNRHDHDEGHRHRGPEAPTPGRFRRNFRR